MHCCLLLSLAILFIFQSISRKTLAVPNAYSNEQRRGSKREKKVSLCCNRKRKKQLRRTSNRLVQCSVINRIKNSFWSEFDWHDITYFFASFFFCVCIIHCVAEVKFITGLKDNTRTHIQNINIFYSAPVSSCVSLSIFTDLVTGNIWLAFASLLFFIYFLFFYFAIFPLHFFF